MPEITPQYRFAPVSLAGDGDPGPSRRAAPRIVMPADTYEGNMVPNVGGEALPMHNLDSCPEAEGPDAQVPRRSTWRDKLRRLRNRLRRISGRAGHDPADAPTATAGTLSVLA